jgi:hypothetical protein
MTRKATLPLILCATLASLTLGAVVSGAAESLTAGKLPPAAKLLPAGFAVQTERDLGGSIVIEGTRANANVPKPHADLGITASCSWSANPMAERMVEMLAQQPEEPATKAPGSVTREEPAGVVKYKNGVLKWRKVITPWVGSGEGPELVAYRGGWVGAASGGLLSIGVNNFVGSKEGALALIEEMIQKAVPPPPGISITHSAPPTKSVKAAPKKTR